MAKIADIDYLYASARVRALENSLLNHERLRRMAEAPNDDEAVKILSECGYGDNLEPANLEQALLEKQAYLFREAEKMLPEPALLGLFRLKYDYHNIKALLKGQAQGQPYAHLLLDTGMTPRVLIEKAGEESNFGDLPAHLRDAARAAAEVLDRTHDPRLADTVLDQAMYAEMLRIAEGSEVKFLLDYVRLAIDSANLRMAVRLRLMGQGFARLGDFYIAGGTVPLQSLKVDMTAETLEGLYKEGHPLHAAALAGAKALRGESGLAELDRAADDALLEHLQQAKYVGFGVEPVLAFVAAGELESAAVHTVMAGRRVGDAPQLIMERLRKTYV